MPLQPTPVDSPQMGDSCPPSCSPSSDVPETLQAWRDYIESGLEEKLRDASARMERDRRKLLLMCERAHSICMGDCESSDMDDWVTDYNETKREISWENARDLAPPP